MPQQHSIAILDDYEDAAHIYADWSRLTPTPITVFREAMPSADLASTLEPFSIIHAMRERTKFDRALLEKLPNLKLIATTGRRNRGIDLVAAKEHDILVCGTWRDGDKGSSAGAVEQTWALILALARRVISEHEGMRVGGWITGVATGLAGKTLGLVGVGRLGADVARIGKAFGMRVIAWSPHLTPERAEQAGAEFAPSLEDLLRQSDFVSLHLVLADSTRGIIGVSQLAQMKQSAFLINTSRGPLVDEDALVEALRAGKIRGAGLDVYDQEPLPREHVLRTLSNVVLSPHMGYVDDTSFESWWPLSVENIESFLAGKPIRLLEA
ncbi:hypothetical protein JCM10908_001706 [Rhodotorula pacifica]|uniref:D-2-hydroxyacid dehydrogenase family protein n=1 Tax=Rhodotorula pacifica TaxID=1495444 RepID=UPI003175C40D